MTTEQSAKVQTDRDEGRTRRETARERERQKVRRKDGQEDGARESSAQTELAGTGTLQPSYALSHSLPPWRIACLHACCNGHKGSQAPVSTCFCFLLEGSHLISPLELVAASFMFLVVYGYCAPRPPSFLFSLCPRLLSLSYCRAVHWSTFGVCQKGQQGGKRSPKSRSIGLFTLAFYRC